MVLGAVRSKSVGIYYVVRSGYVSVLGRFARFKPFGLKLCTHSSIKELYAIRRKCGANYVVCCHGA